MTCRTAPCPLVRSQWSTPDVRPLPSITRFAPQDSLSRWRRPYAGFRKSPIVPFYMADWAFCPFSSRRICVSLASASKPPVQLDGSPSFLKKPTPAFFTTIIRARYSASRFRPPIMWNSSGKQTDTLRETQEHGAGSAVLIIPAATAAPENAFFPWHFSFGGHNKTLPQLMCGRVFFRTVRAGTAYLRKAAAAFPPAARPAGSHSDLPGAETPAPPCHTVPERC